MGDNLTPLPFTLNAYMKLPNLPFFTKEQTKEYFLALLFQDEQIQAVVFEETNQTLRILNSATQTLVSPLETIPFEKLLNALDKAISNAESLLPNGIQTHKTIFGLKQTWVDNAQIKKDYLMTFKKACEELDLQPIGFLIFPEAIAHLLQLEEGAPVSGILLEIGATTVNATLLRAGKIIVSRHGPLSENNIPKSVDNLLAYFVDVEILPSRIILADDQKRPELTQQFIHHQWSKQLPFLHVPQITPLPEGFDTRAILYGTATQMNFKVTDTPRTRVTTSPTQQFAEGKLPDEEQDASLTEDEQAEQAPEETEEDTVEEVIPTKPTAKNGNESESFGFVQDTDVAEDIDDPTEFGSHLKDNAYEESEDEIADETFDSIPEEVKDKEQGLGTRAGSLGLSGILTTRGFHAILTRLRRQVKNGNLSLGTFGALFAKLPTILGPLLRGPKIVLLVPLFLILILGSILWYIFGLKATVTLTMTPQNIDASQDITVTTKDTTDLSQNTLGGTAVSIDESGSVTTDATGKKDTGDKAKGTVTLYNSDTNSKNFSAGTTITSENGLKFTLDKDVTVASASGDIFSGTKPGTQDVAVTASTFGTDYNLPSSTKFSVSGTSSVAAKNASAFSGGTKKSLTVVAAADISQAQKDLIDKLQDKAKQDMQGQNGGSKTILPIFTSTSLSQKSTDKSEGDQANSVTLTATVTYESIAYTSDDVKKLAESLLQGKIANDMTPTADGIKADLQDASANKDGSDATATLKASASLIPKIDTQQVAQKLAGKSFSAIQPTLSDIKQLTSADVTLAPNLFFLPHTLPRLSSHITVKISQ